MFPGTQSAQRPRVVQPDKGSCGGRRNRTRSGTVKRTDRRLNYIRRCGALLTCKVRDIDAHLDLPPSNFQGAAALSPTSVLLDRLRFAFSVVFVCAAALLLLLQFNADAATELNWTGLDWV